MGKINQVLSGFYSLKYCFSRYIEQDPEELFQSVLNCISKLEEISKNQKYSSPISCGIANQRESIVAFNKTTGMPLSNVISWMDGRTFDSVKNLQNDSNYLKEFERLTGLKASTFFSAFKIKWILDNLIPKDFKKIDLAFATIDSWILWKLTGGSSFYTDHSNASRTFLYDLKSEKWSEKILKYFGIEENWLPQIKSFNSIYGTILNEFPFPNLQITALLGDQQSSLIGHWGQDFIGMTKCTFGTGAFLVKSLETDERDISKGNYLKTLIIPGKFAKEYPIVCAGSLIKWLQNGLEMIKSSNDLDSMDFNSKSVESSAYFIPNLAGCLFPSWDPSAKGSFHNISLKTYKNDLILAVFESIAFSIRRALENENVSILSVDGGMCKNRQFCQLLANICNCSISKKMLKFVFYSIFLV